MAGFTDAAASIHPWSRSSGTYTGARKSTKKTGICMSGAAWIVRNRIAIPPAQKKPQKLTSMASTKRPKTSTTPPLTFIPTARATTVKSAATTSQRTNAASA